MSISNGSCSSILHGWALKLFLHRAYFKELAMYHVPHYDIDAGPFRPLPVLRGSQDPQTCGCRMPVSSIRGHSSKAEKRQQGRAKDNGDKQNEQKQRVYVPKSEASTANHHYRSQCRNPQYPILLCFEPLR